LYGQVSGVTAPGAPPAAAKPEDGRAEKPTAPRKEAFNSLVWPLSMQGAPGQLDIRQSLSVVHAVVPHQYDKMSEAFSGPARCLQPRPQGLHGQWQSGDGQADKCAALKTKNPNKPL
jgi:hypothetical protein